MQTRWLFRVTYLYLTIPFIIFCVGWLRLPIAIPATAIVLWVLWKLLNQNSNDQPLTIHYSQKTFYFLLLITGLRVLLSGVGGYAFQNWDHHWRNAVLHDLTTYDWPVVYSAPDRGPIKMLVYYVGYWLPSALVGKAFGWKAANFFLFLWTWLGVFLVTLHLGRRIKASPIRIAFLLILFSGMDALGSLLFVSDYPTLWPPIQHLEIWSGNLQYSSFTTQLFWVFNQAVPAWLCISMFVSLSEATLAPHVVCLANHAGEGLQHSSGDSSLPKERVAQNDIIGQMTFTWVLCFFFAPLASIGLLPYLLIEWVKQRNIKGLLKDIRFDLFFANALIVLVSYLFFSSNSAAQERGLQSLAIKDFLAFFLLEGGILWLLLAPYLWRDPRWVVTGILLFVMPFIQLGSGRDFVMRASIAPLFYLMLMVGETIFQKTTNRVLLFTFYFLLLFGSLTPLYEIDRSVYRSVQYYFFPTESDCGCEAPSSEPVTHLEPGIAPEAEHPGELVADAIDTLEFMNDKLSRNFIANVRQSLYYRYLSPH